MKDKIEEIFINGGSLSTVIDNYLLRDGQLDFAFIVADAINENKIAIAEAGTGIGKSFAYLAPSILNVLANEEDKTIIATSAKELQNQLYYKDIPLLLKALNLDIKYSLALGRGNYICKRRVYENDAFINQNSPMFSFFENAELGVKSEYHYELPYNVKWEDILSLQELCKKQNCKYINECFYYKSRQEAKNAKLVVTNHHILFIDSKIRLINSESYAEDALLPNYNRLIIDECHNIDKNATTYFTSCYNLTDLSICLNKLKIKDKSSNNHLLTKVCKKEYLYLAAEVISSLNTVESEAKHFNDQLCYLMQNNKTKEIRVLAKDKKYLEHLLNLAFNLSIILKNLSTNLDLMIKDVEVNEDNQLALQIVTSVISELESYYIILVKFSNIDDLDEDKDVCYLKLVQYYKRTYCEINIAPLEIGSLLKESLFSQLDSIVCTSATVKISQDFNYFKDQVGLKGFDTIEENYPSPFSYSENLLILNSDTKYVNSEKHKYAPLIAPKIIEAIKLSNGGALVLFTNYEMLNNVYSLVKDDLSEFNLLKQEQGQNANRLLQEFKRDENSVFFATQTFWEGIDVPGNSLRMLIITQLPYPFLKDSLITARGDYLEKHGQNRFLVSFNHMKMKLKQGFGRLIRSENDRGIVYILDNRGQFYLNFFSDSNMPQITSDDCLEQKIESFLYPI